MLDWIKKLISSDPSASLTRFLNAYSVILTISNLNICLFMMVKWYKVEYFPVVCVILTVLNVVLLGLLGLKGYQKKLEIKDIVTASDDSTNNTAKNEDKTNENN